MSMKKTDLVRQLESKLEGQRQRAAVPGRFAQELPVDRKQQRRIDAAAGLVPFACKLPATLTAQLSERAASHAGGINGLVAELLQRGLA
jgi:hypothetical protein